MRKDHLWAISVTLSSLSLAQETSTADPLVLDEVVYQQGKDTLIIQRIEEPEDPKPQQASPAPASKKSHTPSPEAVPQSTTFVIHAESFGPEATRFKLWPVHLGPTDAMEGWSNIDWSLLQTVTKIQAADASFNFLLFQTGRDQEEATPPATLPKIQATGSRYLITSPPAQDRDRTFQLLEALHEKYHHDQTELTRDLEQAKKTAQVRRRRIEIERAKPKTRILKIWWNTSKED